jgi:hypothetical protein
LYLDFDIILKNVSRFDYGFTDTDPERKNFSNEISLFVHAVDIWFCGLTFSVVSDGPFCVDLSGCVHSSKNSAGVKIKGSCG